MLDKHTRAQKIINQLSTNTHIFSQLPSNPLAASQLPAKNLSANTFILNPLTTIRSSAN